MVLSVSGRESYACGRGYREMLPGDVPHSVKKGELKCLLQIWSDERRSWLPLARRGLVLSLVVLLCV